LAPDAARFKGKDKFTGGIIVVHEDLHLIEVLVGTQFGGAFDSHQISRRAGLAYPVLPARIIKACPAVA
jgi:hypothetical protein